MNEIKTSGVNSYSELKGEFTKWINERINEELGANGEWAVRLTDRAMTVRLKDVSEIGSYGSFDVYFGKEVGSDDMRWRVRVFDVGEFTAMRESGVNDFFVGVGKLLSSEFFNEELRERLNGEFVERVKAIKDYLRNRSK